MQKIKIKWKAVRRLIINDFACDDCGKSIDVTNDDDDDDCEEDEGDKAGDDVSSDGDDFDATEVRPGQEG